MAAPNAKDAELSARVGAEFGLGAVELVSRDMDDPVGLRATGCITIVVSVFLGLPIAGGLAISPAPADTKEIIAAVFGALIAAGGLLMAVGTPYELVGTRLALYSGGVARLNRKEPEPRVLRWADIESVTISLTTDEETPPTGVRSYTLRGTTGMEIGGDANAETVVLAAHRALAPRLVPPLIETFDSGQEVAAAALRIGPGGLTLPSGRRLAWAEIKSLTMLHASPASAELITRIDVVEVRTNRVYRFDPSGVPNAIFLAHVLARAATRNGVAVHGYDGTGDEQTHRGAAPA